MKNKVLGLFLLFALFLGCSEDPQESLWKLKPDYEVKPDPIVTSVLPESGAYSGIDELQIIGQNFGNDKNHVRVYVGNKPATVVTVEDTRITAIAPVIAGDSLLVKVQVDGALLFGISSPYKLEFAEAEYGGITGQSNAFGIACDLEENLYVSLGEGKIIKIDSEENQTDYITKEQGVDGFYPAMKMGPGGVLYTGRTKYIYKAAPGGGLLTRFTTQKLSEAVNDFDFDPYGDLYVAAKKGIIFVETSDASSKDAASYPNITLNAIRVFDGYVYVAGTYTGFAPEEIQKGVWRNKILAEGGQLGENELVIDWHSSFSGNQSPPILAMTFADDGYMYLGIDSTSHAIAITQIPPNGDKTYSIENSSPLYPAVLFPPSAVFCWGNDQYLYVNRKNSDDTARLIKITMGKNSAPYYGRQ